MVVGLPEEMLAGIDDLVSGSNQSRSLFIREACHFYIEEKRKEHLREQMKTGYQEMAELNRLLAEEMACDFDCLPRLPDIGDYFCTAGEGLKDDSPGWRKT